MVWTKKESLNESSWFGEPKCKIGSKVADFFVFLFIFIVFFYPCLNSTKIKDMLWIEDIVESTSTLPFLTNSRVDMVGFMDLHKVFAKSSAFSTFPSA